MQLLLILALLLYGGKAGGKDMLSEVRPMLENFGGEEMKEALKNAEEISEMLTAVKSFTDGISENKPEAEKKDSCKEENGGERVVPPTIGFPLAPIMSVADKDIAYSLSKYIAQEK